MRPDPKVLAFALLASACGGSTLEPLPIPPGCNPLHGSGECFLPYPSDVFRVPDETLPSRFRIETRGAAKRRLADGTSADVTDWGPEDGFSITPTIVAAFGAEISTDGLAGIFDPPERSLSFAENRTLILRADTGEPVPHFADRDPFATKPEEEALILQPIVALEPLTRYVVALAKLTSAAGGVIPPHEGFRRIRDRETDADPELAALRERYDADIFPLIERAGARREDVQLAWDFTTGSREHLVHDMFRMRELVLERLRTSPPEIEIEAVEEPMRQEDGVWRIVRGTLRGPKILDSDRAGGRLLRDANGEVRIEGELEFPFVAVVPIAVRDSAAPARAVAYGHGFFGSRREIEYAAPVAIANRLGAVLFSIDWWGMDQRWVGVVLDALATRPSEATAFSDGIHQGMANWLAMIAAVRGPLAELPAFRRDGRGAIYDPDALSYLGISQGHILGGVLAAIAPDIERYCLNVGGASYTHMMYRASPFLPYLAVLSIAMPDPLERQRYTASLQRGFDRMDPASYAHYVLDEKLPGSPADRQVLMQVGLGDTSVPNHASFLHARMLGLGITRPGPDVWGLPSLPADGAASGLTAFDFGVDQSFALVREPPQEETPVHEGVRRLEAAQLQMDRFFRTGAKVTHPCDGPCDPE